ncbi:MAG: YdeI/OmpD-associated family protein [Salibacteraceae bacterium]
MAVAFTTQLERFEDSPLWGYHLVVPNEIAEDLIEGDDRRMVCTLENKISFHCALMPSKTSGWFIMINKSNRNKLGLVRGQVMAVQLEKDTSDYGMPMPDELHELLLQDEVGSDYFHALTPGKQRNLIHFVGQVKSSDIRLRRAFVVVEHLKMHQGVINFKALSQEMKAANQLYNRK